MSADSIAPEELFLDTNILVYAYDRDAGRKHEMAKSWLREFWESSTQPRLSVQVLQEFHVTLVRKRFPVEESAALIGKFTIWPVIANSISILAAALKIQARFQLSFWDSNILAAAAASGCSHVWSEDLNAGQDYGSVKVVNPFEDAA